MQPGIEGSLTFCSDVWPPYVNAQDSGREGYVIDLLREIYEPLGYNVELEIIPWSRCLEAVSSGRTTGVIGADEEEAPDLVFPAETMGAYHPLFYTLSNSKWIYKGIETLHDIRLGVAQDYSYSDEMDAYIEQSRQTDRIMLSKGEQPLDLLLNALHEGRLDAFVEDQFTINAFMGNHSEIKQDLRVAGALTTNDRMYVAFSPMEKGSIPLAKRYDRRINKLRNGGFLAKILANYNLKDWQENPAQAAQGQLRERQP
jgi:polar amino acid transport system substrate-binding protein